MTPVYLISSIKGPGIGDHIKVFPTERNYVLGFN